MDLKFAKLVGDTWSVSTIDSDGDTGINPDLSFLSDDTPVVTYFSQQNNELEVASYRHKGWHISAIGASAGEYTSVATNPATGVPSVAYENASGEIETASLSRPGASSATQLGTNLAGPAAISLAYSPTDNAAVAYENARSKVIKLAQSDPDGDVAVTTIASVPKGTNSQATLLFNPATGSPQVVYDNSSLDGTFLAKYHPATSSWQSKPLQYGVTVVADAATVAPGNAIVYAAIDTTGTATLAVNNTASTPAPPTKVEATAISTNQINVTWADPTQDSTEFVVAQSTDDVNFTPVAMVDPTVTQYTATNLAPATTYYYQVSAVGTDGSQSLGIVAADATSASQVTAASTTQPAGPVSMITGIVYEDANDSGTFNSAGVGAPPQSDSWGGSIANLGDYSYDYGIGTQLTLTGVDTNGNSVGPITVSSDPGTGDYSFGGLNAGTYTIKLVAPAGYLPGKENSSGIIASVVVTTGETLAAQNFGEILPAAVNGFVYNDANDDGAMESGESGITGVTVALNGTDDLGDTVSLNTTTASSGSYSFTNLRPGTYTVTETAPSGFLADKQNTGSSGSQALAQGGALNAIDFGELAPASVAGYVYNDANDNGTMGSGDAGISGVSIALTGTNDLGNAVSLNSTTASSGAYSFANLRPGTYTVTETAPSGLLAGNQNPSGSVSQIIVAGANSTGVNFAELSPATVSGFVYNDTNDNGTMNSGEAGISGVSIALTGTNDLGNAVSLNTTTASSGAYSFGNLRPGAYTVTETAPSGLLPGLQNPTGSSGSQTVTAGASLSGISFGEITPATVSGYVYNDVNDDGTKQSGESGISGVTIALSGTNDLGNTVALNTTTSSSGAYSFINLRPGTYTITETAPSGYLGGKQ
ncbi:MAG: SdrD B-like domain-containing protein, partial [Tepidisphaeraceae bacterium]